MSEILIEVNEQTVDIQQSVDTFNITQDTSDTINITNNNNIEIATSNNIFEVSSEIIKTWNVINLDKTDTTYYYIQSKLENETLYKIQRINKSTYAIGWWFGTTDEWLNRETITYE